MAPPERASLKSQLHQPRLADVVADALRRRILSGGIEDGEMLPKQEELFEEFGVSKQSVRAALRILEAEGLITIRRGNVGGAVVHLPRAQNAAYMLGLVLQSRGVTMADVSAALNHLEPVCASLCAERADRRTTVVPRLRAVHEAARAAQDDEQNFATLTRQFHQALVDCCGNETLIAVVGALESLWSAHEQEYVETTKTAGGFPARKYRTARLAEHDEILALIEAGDVAAVAKATEDHYDSSLLFASAGNAAAPIEAAFMRGRRRP